MRSGTPGLASPVDGSVLISARFSTLSTKYGPSVCSGCTTQGSTAARGPSTEDCAHAPDVIGTEIPSRATASRRVSSRPTRRSSSRMSHLSSGRHFAEDIANLERVHEVREEILPETPDVAPKEFGIPAPGYRLPDDTRVGLVRLQVADLEQSLDYYGQVLGLRPLTKTSDTATLAASDDTRPLVELHAKSGARPVPRGGVLGLYHFAI